MGNILIDNNFIKAMRNGITPEGKITDHETMPLD
jgi:hypothetical protein